MKILLLSIILLCPSLFGRQYASLDQYKDYQQYKVYSQFSALYPDEAKKDRFKTTLQSEEAFIKKYPKVTIIQLTDLTRQLGAISWFFNVYRNYNKDPNNKSFQEEMGIWDKVAYPVRKYRPEKPNNLNNYEDLLLWFYQQNFVDDVLKAKHAVDRYIYKSAFQGKVDRNRLEKVDNNHLRMSQEVEWEICQHFINDISTIFPPNSRWDIYKKEISPLEQEHDFKYKGYKDAKHHASSFSFMRRAERNEIINFLVNKDDKGLPHHVNGHEVLLGILNDYRNNPSDIFFYRSTDQFQKNNAKVLDSTFSETINNPTSRSLSYGLSLFGPLFDDVGASPLGYWRTKNYKMQQLQIPIKVMQQLIQERIIVFRPFFSLTEIFIGGGEWHPRTGLPKIIFKEDGSWNINKCEFNCFNSLGQHPGEEIKCSHQFFNSGLDVKELEKKVNEVILNYLKVLGDSSEGDTKFYKEEIKKYLKSL